MFPWKPWAASGCSWDQAPELVWSGRGSERACPLSSYDNQSLDVGCLMWGCDLARGGCPQWGSSWLWLRLICEGHSEVTCASFLNGDLHFLVGIPASTMNLQNSVLIWSWAGFPESASRKEPTCQPAGDIRDMGSIPGSGGYPGEGRGNQLQYSCLESPMDRGAWWTTVHGVTKSWT